MYLNDHLGSGLNTYGFHNRLGKVDFFVNQGVLYQPHPFLRDGLDFRTSRLYMCFAACCALGAIANASRKAESFIRQLANEDLLMSDFDILLKKF